MGIQSSADLASIIAHIDFAALQHNLGVVRRKAAGLDIIAVVKANAYGHGAIPVTRFLALEGVEQFAVATLNEAIALRDAGIPQRILVFAAPIPEQLATYARHDLEVTVSSPAAAAAIARTAARNGPLKCHVKIDTGMGRIGVSPDEAMDVIRTLERAPGVSIVALWTHFATADDPDDTFLREQWRRWRAVMERIGDPPAPVHVANSGCVIMNPVGLDPYEVSAVRVGISLYGMFDPPVAAEPDRLHPVMRLTSRLTQVKTVPAGTPISYGATWRTPRTTRIGTVAAGYADGYRRAYSNRAAVGVHGVLCPVAGRVCMDMFMVDLGPEGEGPPARPGDEVVLMGSGGPSVHQLAQWAETITYEVTCGLTDRVSRRYHEPTAPGYHRD